MYLIKELYLTSRFFQAMAGVAAVYVAGYFVPALSAAGSILLMAFIILSLLDYLLLFREKEPFSGERICPKRLSNGDENEILINLNNRSRSGWQLQVIDEIPHEFQYRDFSLNTDIQGGESKSLRYSLRPVQRGAYDFGDILLFIKTTLGLVERKYRLPAAEEVPVYPSYVQMRKFEMYAISNRLTDIGVKKIRRLGHTMEFDRIKEYVRGDDVRSINWKATARAGDLMVNQYRDERSQQVISAIDLGRVMKMPFNGLHLLDYAINTSLVISNIALLRDDKAGLITYNHESARVIKPEKRRTHIQRIQEGLYKTETNFLESDPEQLIIALRRHVRQRSLVLLYTNYENLRAMKRQLPYLRQIAKDHLLVTIFFENTELETLVHSEPQSTEEIYTKTIAEKFRFEKRQIVKALNQHGIQTILTPPENLSVNAINKYLELKARGLL